MRGLIALGVLFTSSFLFAAANPIPLENGLVVNADGTYQNANSYNVQTRKLTDGNQEIIFSPKMMDKGTRSSTIILIKDSSGLRALMGSKIAQPAQITDSYLSENGDYWLYSPNMSARCSASKDNIDGISNPKALLDCRAITLKRCQDLRHANNAFAAALGNKSQQDKCKAAANALVVAVDNVKAVSEQELKMLQNVFKAPVVSPVMMMSLLVSQPATAFNWKELSGLEKDCEIIESMTTQRKAAKTATVGTAGEAGQ